MYAVKNEFSDAVCRGCLSTDRRLSPLTNHDLFLALLNNKQSVEDLKYFNILLCWECTALLQSTEAFQKRLQDAQCFLAMAHDNQIPSITFSTLSFHHKQDYDYTIEEAIESKQDIETFTDNCPDVDIKQEPNVDDFENDNYSESEFKEVKVKKESRKSKRYGDGSNLKIIDNGIDFSNLGLYFSRVCLSETEVEESLAKDRDDGDSVSRPFKCGSCGFRFGTKTELFCHKRDNHRNRRASVKCPLCASVHSSRADLQVHWRRSHPVNRCGFCSRIVEREKDRLKHLYQHKIRYHCVKCDVAFSNKQLFSYHEKQLHSKYVCGHCGRTNSAKKSLERHIMNNHLPNPCPVCGLVLATRARLLRHAPSHIPAPPDAAYCVECDTTFPTRAKYKRHLTQSARHKPKKKISIPCPECGKIFSRKTYMKNHVKLFHSNDSKHHCALCDKYFVTGFALRSHNKYVHEKIPVPKTKMCNVCGRGFGTNRVLENHMRTHTGERPFACVRCTAAFAQRVALRAHLAAIHKEK